MRLPKKSYRDLKFEPKSVRHLHTYIHNLFEEYIFSKNESYDAVIAVLGVIDLLKTQELNREQPRGGSDIQELYKQIDRMINHFKLISKDKIPTYAKHCWYDELNMPHYQAEELLTISFRGIFSTMEKNFYNKYINVL